MPLKPGQRHRGQFRKGHDPRRATGVQIANGKTLAQLARENSEDAFNVVLRLAKDPKQPPAIQLKAAQHVLDRAWGKAPTHLVVEELERAPEDMTTSELAQLIQQRYREERTIEGEFMPVEQPLLSGGLSSNG